jgi:2-alkyl-3-oxoalkanoate reductase
LVTAGKPVIGSVCKTVSTTASIEDAASATIAAIEANSLGLYNICDDELAPVSQWLPFLAHSLGAKAPRYIPKWIGRMVIGAHAVAWMTEIRGASNRKAKSFLRWKLKWPSRRTGFVQGLENSIQEADPRTALLTVG